MKSDDPKYKNCWLAKKYCAEDISLIENYAVMIADKTQRWVCHHRLEISENKSKKQLLSEGRYYNRPACELIFLTASDHLSLHHKDVSKTDEHKQHISEALTGVPLSDERKRNISEATKSAMNRPDVKQRHSEAMNRQDVKDKCAKGGKKAKGKHWWNNGVKNVFCEECPPGYEPGMLKL